MNDRNEVLGHLNHLLDLSRSIQLYFYKNEIKVTDIRYKQMFRHLNEIRLDIRAYGKLLQKDEEVVYEGNKLIARKKLIL